MIELPRPLNLLMPFRGHRITVQVHSHVPGEITVAAGENGAPKTIACTRLFTTRLDKDSPAMHVDVTSQQPAAMLEGFLMSGAHVGKAITFRARGRGPRRRDTIHIKPIA